MLALFIGVYLSTQLVVILAEAYDALSHIIISAFLLISIWWSEKPTDEFHMFGHGRVQNVGALVAATTFILWAMVRMGKKQGRSPAAFPGNTNGEFRNLGGMGDWFRDTVPCRAI